MRSKMRRYLAHPSDCQPSDDDDDRLVIDTSGDDEEESMSSREYGRSPLLLAAKLTPEAVLAKAMPELEKHIANDPKLDKMCAVPQNCADFNSVEDFVQKGMEDPKFRREIAKVELTPDLVKVLDRCSQENLSWPHPVLRNDPLSLLVQHEQGIGSPPSANAYMNFGKSRPSSETSTADKEQYFPYATQPSASDMAMISVASTSGNQGCETLPITDTRSIFHSSFPAPVNAKSRRKRNALAVKHGCIRKTHELSKYPPPEVVFKDTPPPATNTTERLEVIPERPEVIIERPEVITERPDYQKHIESKIAGHLANVTRHLANAAHDELQLRGLRDMKPEQSAQFQKFRENFVPFAAPAPHISEILSKRTELTITPKTKDDRGRNDVESVCTRNRPHMLPMVDYNSLVKPFIDAKELLKRFGTDIQLECVPPPSRPVHSSIDCGSSLSYMTGSDYDDEATLPVECVIEETPNSSPCFNFEPSTSKMNTARACSIPPPDLIPLNMGIRYPPLRPLRMKSKPKPEVSITRAALEHTIAQNLVRTVQRNDLPIAQPLYQPSTSQDKTVTRKREVNRIKIPNTPQPKNAKKRDNASLTSIEFVVSKLKQQKPIEKKTTSESAVAIADETTAIPVEATSVVQEPSESQKDLEAVMNNVQLAENKLAEPTEEGDTSESLVASNPVSHIGKTSLETSGLGELPVTSGKIVSPPPSSLFVFNCDSAVITTSDPTQRKLYACSICSVVYRKMCSLKKHYFRNHINPRMVTEEDARKYGLEANAKNSTADEKLYRCHECKEVFDEIPDLRKHLLVHPVAANESFKRRSKSKTPYHCDNCDMAFAKKQLYYQHSSNCQKVGAAAPESQDVIVSEPTVASVRESKKVSHSQDNTDEVDEEKKDALGISQMCLFCDLTFTSTAARKSHVLEQHPPQRKYHPCSYCKGKKFIDLKDLLKHICGAHSKRYFGCAMCKIRFKTKGDLTAHNAESHPPQSAASQRTAATNEKAKPASSVPKPGKVHKCTKCSAIFPSDKELKRHRKKGHNVGKPVNTVKAKCSAFTTDPYPQKYRSASSANADYETEFYKNVTKNVRLNLDQYLDGKLTDTGVIIDQKSTIRRSALQLKTRSTISRLQHKLQEWYNENFVTFQQMYGTENLNGGFISNVSRLHLGTQLAVLQKANVLENEPNSESASTSHSSSTTTPKDFALTQNEKKTENGENENVTSPAVTPEETEDNESPFSGEWIRPKKYICSTCYTRFNNLCDMEDHSWTKHPNVWMHYTEFPADQTPGPDWAMERILSRTGALNTTIENNSSNTSPPSKCTKCQKVVTPIAEFHKHILECGGDTTWSQTMVSASSSSKKHKKWRPYGCRRRKNTGRVRGLKRNIPTTPVKMAAHPKNRQKAGDTETIQKMIANLPPKRITRRIVQFDDIDSKNKSRTNSNNAPSESNILTRQRRERLDTRASTSMASASTESATVKAPSSRKRKSRRRTTKKSKKAAKTTTSSPIESGDQTSNASTSFSETDIRAKEEIDCSAANASKELEINSAPSPHVETVIPSCVPKPEEEVPEMDLEEMELADSDVLLPPTSVVIACMRDTLRETDPIIPTQSFTPNSKKRKRDDSKCKQDLAETSESHEEPESKRPALPSIICTVCKSPFSDNGGSIQVCESCHSKSGSTRSASLRPRQQSRKVRELRNVRKPSVQQKSSSESVVEVAGGENSKVPSSVKQKKSTGAEKEDSASKNDVTATTKSRKSVTKVTDNDTPSTSEEPKTDGTSVDSKCSKKTGASKNSRRSKTQSAEKSETGTSATDDRAPITENVNDDVNHDIALPKAEEVEIDQNGSNEVSSNSNMVLKKVSKTFCSTTFIDESGKIIKNSKSTSSNGDVLESKIIVCEVCRNPSMRSICNECSFLSRKYKVCVYCKQENTYKPCNLPVCVACRDLSSRREIKDWTLCKVCHCKNNRDVCSKCVAMSHKLEICALCSTPGVYTQNSGRPVCQDCDKKWFPDTIGDDDRFAGYNVSSVIELVSKIRNALDPVAEPSDTVKSCDTNDVNTPIDDNDNACIDATMDVVVTDSTPVAEAPPASTATISSLTNPSILSTIPYTSIMTAPAPPTTSAGVSTLPILAINSILVPSTSNLAASRSVSEDIPANNSPSKKNSRLFLECRGCSGIYETVSSYKLHCVTCRAHHNTNNEEKRPLLGFVSGSTTLVSSDANGAGPSHEISEAAKMKSSVNEDAKAESHSVNDTPGSLYDSDSSTSSKRLELNKSMKTKRSLATDKSMNEAIESVIKRMRVSEDSSPSDSAACSSTPRPSSDATEVSVTNLQNFEKVKNDLETMLETSNTDNESSAEVLFPNEEQTVAAESVGKSKKRKITPKVKKVASKRPTTRSSLAKSEVEVPAKKGEGESNTSSSSDNQSGTKLTGGEYDTIATRLRRKLSDMQSLFNEESAADDADAGAAAMRLRRKPPVEKTNRTLRSRRKIETADKVDETPKAEEDSVEEAPNTTKSRKSKDLKRKTDLVEPTPEDEKKPPPAEEEVQGDPRPNKKLKTDNGLGFAAVKANKPTRKGVIRDSSESSLPPPPPPPPKNESSQSDRKVQKLSCESDEILNSSIPEYNSVSGYDFYGRKFDEPLEDFDPCSFLGPPSTSTAVTTYEEPLASTSSGLFDDPMYLSVDQEASEAPSFEGNHHDRAEASTWCPFLEVTSLGSILDSVNDLLSRPEVVQSCVSDTITTQSVKDAQRDGLVLRSDANDGAKANEDHLQQEDESPTLMDLDHQTAHHSEKEEAPVSLDDEEPSVGPNSKNSDEAKMKLACNKTRTSPRTNQNDLEVGQKCSQCQLVLVGKREMASHVDEHVTTFATNQGCDAAALRRGIAEKLEVLIYNNAFDNYKKSPQESSTRPSTSSKTVSTVCPAKNTRISQWNPAALKSLTEASNAIMVARSASKQAKKAKKIMTSREQLSALLSNAKDGNNHYPCPMCTATFNETVARNSHLILIHAPRSSTHPTRATSNESSSKTLSEEKTNESTESSAKSDEKVIRSYLLNESVNSCLEAKREAVHKAIVADFMAKNTNVLSKQAGRPTADSLPSSFTIDLQTIEGPPALEPAPSGEQVLNNTDRSPPKLEASTGASVPSTSGSSSLPRPNPTPSSSGNVSQKNGKPCRKKMSKKEIDLPPAVVKFKAEQALLELSIGKFKKIRKDVKV